MTHRAHKRPDGKAAKAPNGKPITDSADCCNCGGGGGPGECCVSITPGFFCGFKGPNIDNVVLTITGTWRVQMLRETVLGGSWQPTLEVPGTTISLAGIQQVQDANCLRDWQVRRSLLYFVYNRGVRTRAIGSFEMGCSATITDFWNRQFYEVTPVWYQGSPLPDPHLLPVVNTLLQTRDDQGGPLTDGFTFLQCPDNPVPEERHGGYFGSPEPGGIGTHNSAATGSTVVTTNGCSMTVRNIVELSDILTFGGGENGSRRITQFHTLDMTMVLTSPLCSNANRPSGGALVDPAVEAIFSQYGQCKTCGDGNPMA